MSNLQNNLVPALLLLMQGFTKQALNIMCCRFSIYLIFSNEIIYLLTINLWVVSIVGIPAVKKCLEPYPQKRRIPETEECWKVKAFYFPPNSGRTRRQGELSCINNKHAGLARFRGLANAYNAKIKIRKAFKYRGNY